MKCRFWLKVLIVVLVLTGCHGDYWELGNRYIYLDGTICYEFPSKDDAVRPIKIIICQHVLNYEVYENYIFVYQQVDKDYIKDVYEGKEMDKRVKKSLSMKYCYWIIDTKKNIVYGPYYRTQYEKKKKEIISSVPKQVKHDCVFSFLKFLTDSF